MLLLFDQSAFFQKSCYNRTDNNFNKAQMWKCQLPLWSETHTIVSLANSIGFKRRLTARILKLPPVFGAYSNFLPSLPSLSPAPCRSPSKAQWIYVRKDPFNHGAQTTTTWHSSKSKWRSPSTNLFCEESFQKRKRSEKAVSYSLHCTSDQTTSSGVAFQPVHQTFQHQNFTNCTSQVSYMTIRDKSCRKSARALCTFIAVEILRDDLNGDLEHVTHLQQDAWCQNLQAAFWPL
jgi:hypothetical protein